MPNYVTNIITFAASDKQMAEILNAVRRDGDEYGSFDFNKLIPMPESLDVTDGSITFEAISAFLSHRKEELVQHSDRPGLFEDVKRYLDAAARIMAYSFLFEKPAPMSEKEIEVAATKNDMSVPDFLELGKKYLDNQLQYGAPTWHRWRIENWGTKWNTAEGRVLSDEDNKTVSFDTAWSAPVPIMEALSKKFPTIQIFHRWADEDIGNNVGSQSYLNGDTFDWDIPEPGSAAAYEMAFEVFDLGPEDFRLKYDVKSGTYVYDETLEDGYEPEGHSLADIIDLSKAKAELPPSDKLSRMEDPER